MDPKPSCSKPIHIQRIENAVNLGSFKQTYEVLRDVDSDISDEEEEVVVDDESFEAEREQSDEGQNESEINDVFNFENIDPERIWLVNILQEDGLDGEVDCKTLLSLQHSRKKISMSKEKCARHMYYGAGLLSTFDKYPEIKKTRGTKPTKRRVPKDDIKHMHFTNHAQELDEASNEEGIDFGEENRMIDNGHRIVSELRNRLIQVSTPSTTKKKVRKFKDEESKKKWEDIMTIKRKKLFMSIVKKEIGKQQRAKFNRHKEMLIQCKKASLQCQKVVRHKALQSARLVKEQLWRMKRLARENLAYWKRSKRADREIRRKLEKEAEEQRKMDFEFIEAKRQQRKLNFLITQTELYAHFMSKKLGTGTQEERLRILKQLDEEKIPRLANIDDYDCDIMKTQALKNAEEAFQSERARTKIFDMDASSTINCKRTDSVGEHMQPLLFRGNLKGYQLRGMNWLANLYDQGISGILADEMGLGKTVQSIAFLCHIAEKYSVWGPFLIISPASTLHNWQQELVKFIPDFKVVPYWGNPNERKILRQFWDQKDMHTKEASFHIVVTSYQIVITDIKYFNRIKWQYMILDEAQAIKSTSSMRWKTLLGFSCRNRLLLSGTPIQNSMAELWALLHFIMPTLFDSHEEFNEWFSKDIESHAENKTGIDEKHLSRLHMILKPFMLRRIKKDVENELSDKIEVMVYCPLTTRQKLLYMALKQKIRIEDLLHYTVGGGDSHTVDKNFTSNLMNLVMQFRKVCNHPELFERRDAKSPIYFSPLAYRLPYLLYDYNVRQTKFRPILKYFFFTAEYIAHSLRDDYNQSIFNFATALKLSASDLFKIFSGDILHRWKLYYENEHDDYNSYYRTFYSETVKMNIKRLNYTFPISPASISTCKILKDLVFTWQNTGQHVIYTHTNHTYNYMPETLEHRNIRSKAGNLEDCEPIIDVVNVDSNMKTLANEHAYKQKFSQIFEQEQTLLPTFLFSAIPKLETISPVLYCYSRRAAWEYHRFIDDYSWNSINYHWSEATKNKSRKINNEVTNVTCSSTDTVRPLNGWSHIVIPDKETLVTDSGKLSVLDNLLKRLKEEGHRVLIYSQMTKMIDLLEEYMWHRHHKYMRLDGSSKISERRDMVADFQARADIFVFLLSTRAGGLGINLTAADTVIFYDSDWNPTVDQQAMDRAHRLGQTKQVTVYRLICKGSIEERILQRAREKSEIQKLVISGGNFKPDTLKPKEVVSLLLDDEEIEQKYRQRTEERKQIEDMREMERKRKHTVAFKTVHMTIPETKKIKQESSESGVEEPWLSVDSGPSSPHSDNSTVQTPSEDLSEGGFLDVEGDVPTNSKYTVYNLYGSTVKPRAPGRGSSKRGRPRGSRRVSALGRFNNNPTPNTSAVQLPTSEFGNDLHQPLSTSFDSASSTSSHNFISSSTSPSSGYLGSPGIRRGPGRPRLKPSGPLNTGSRGTYRPRKPARPLPVPLPTDGGGNSSNSNYTSYLFDYNDQNE